MTPLTDAELDGLCDKMLDPASSRWNPGAASAIRALRSERSTLRQLVNDYDEVNTDKKRLVRELDVLLNGEEGAAQQASLCDIVSQIATIQRTASAPFLLERDALRKLIVDADRMVGEREGVTVGLILHDHGSPEIHDSWAAVIDSAMQGEQQK